MWSVVVICWVESSCCFFRLFYIHVVCIHVLFLTREKCNYFKLFCALVTRLKWRHSIASQERGLHHNRRVFHQLCSILAKFNDGSIIILYFPIHTGVRKVFVSPVNVISLQLPVSVFLVRKNVVVWENGRGLFPWQDTPLSSSPRSRSDHICLIVMVPPSTLCLIASI